MKVLYGFSNCTDKLYKRLFDGKNMAVLRPDQKYHSLMIKGLKGNGVNVECFSGLPINRKVTKKPFINYKNEKEDGVKYHYYKTVNLPIFRQIGIFLGGFFGVLFCKREKKNTALLCDALNIANAYGMAAAAKLKKIPVVFIVTDLPEFQYKKGAIRNLAERLFKKADGFVFLTEQMSGKVNKKNKPFVVVEGLSDSDIAPADYGERTEILSGIKDIIYAGGVLSLYGMPELIEGFLSADLKDARLKIYGDGDFAEEVKRAAEKNPDSIKYMGVAPNAQVVEDERKAALLVNPRPTEGEYTKYSFPSKNMEYMAAYTPVLTTRLAGMPKEYADYVYTINGAGSEGIKEALERVFSVPKEERYAFGKKAGLYIKENKNNLAQAGKIADFLRELNDKSKKRQQT